MHKKLLLFKKNVWIITTNTVYLSSHQSLYFLKVPFSAHSIQCWNHKIIEKLKFNNSTPVMLSNGHNNSIQLIHKQIRKVYKQSFK